MRNLHVVIPPATPAGEYTIDVVGRDVDERPISAELHVTVDAVMVSAAATSARVPVILLNGFQLACSTTDSTVAASVGTFGQLAALLQSDGAPVLFFNNCSYGDISIEQLAGQLNAYINTLHYTDGTPVIQADLVAHSMGGLISRAYLAGKSSVSGSFAPPSNPKVHKFVAIATPHFGSFQAGNIGAQESEMVRGSQVLWDLATWNQGQDDLRGVDALAVIGNAGTYGTTNAASDGVVSLTSGSLDFARPDQRTRIVPYCHVTPGFLSGLGMSCSSSRGIADIDTASHLTAQIVRSFLADTSAWQSIGTTPSQNPFLSIYGGAFAALKGSNDVYFRDLTSVQFDNGASQLLIIWLLQLPPMGSV
jgi:pimeloyl-ACP methyl ester carboxylesterase